MKYTVLGTGAVGGYYGARLQKSGLEVDFLARSDYSSIKEKGLRIDSCQGDFVLDRVNVYSSAEELPTTDVILVALKTTANDKLEELLRPVVKKGTAILILQNGLGMEEEVSVLFPEAVVLGGMCFICSQKRGDGHIVHLDKGSISAAPLREKDRDLLRTIQGDFQSAGVKMALLDDLTTARWNKLLWNIPYNGLSVVLDADTAQIMASPHGCRLAKTLMEEVIRGGEACGSTFPDGSIENMLEYTRIMTPYEPSMKLDFDMGRRMELEYMYRRPLKAALERGVALPYIAMLADQLAFREERN
jgi:2-dehydropantoate 2-reductase